MEVVAEHIRETWSYAGAEVHGVTATKVNVSVGPEFPISDFCADMAGSFDAIVSLKHINAVGTTVVVALSAPPLLVQPRTMPWLLLVIILLLIAAIWDLTVTKRFLTFNATLPAL